MGDDPMALLGLEGALKHYYYYYATHMHSIAQLVATAISYGLGSDTVAGNSQAA
jgi:hypothetical protein